ncbi:MAG: sulfurtransferase [Actinomycetota bacterium]|nr:sulfurtransferase [Actinomycetota bacterium]
MTVLITVDDLANAIASKRPPVLLDVRWALAGPPGHDEYLKGHIPGAVFVDLDTELSAIGLPAQGRHPLPSPEQLQSAARRWGINPGDSVVAYDGEGNLISARAWWLLRWAGFTDVRLLDGALPAWVAAGHPLATDDVAPILGVVELSSGAVRTLDQAEIEDFTQRGLLLDAREPERFRGELEPVDPKAGHIPGARNAPTRANLDSEGRFLPVDELQARFAALGVNGARPVGVYCGSGVTAAHEIAALEIVGGFKTALYAGSWSQWSNHDLPIATGI